VVVANNCHEKWRPSSEYFQPVQQHLNHHPHLDSAPHPTAKLMSSEAKLSTIEWLQGKQTKF
jgi:hypothetical protein